MKKTNLLILAVSAIICCGIFLYLVNPNNPQYKSYYLENQALEALKKEDINKYFKDMNNPASIKYHTDRNLILSKMYVSAGRYKDALRVINAYEKNIDYSYCMAYKPAMRFVCRITSSFNKPDFPYDKNREISYVYFEKGDYKKAVEFYEKAKKQDSCFAVRLYSASGDIETAEKNLAQCAIEQKNKKYPRAFYTAKGYSYLMQGKYDLALYYFEKDLGTTKCGQGRFEKCRGNNQTYLYTALCYIGKGQTREAKEYYEKVLSTEPWNFKAKKGLKSIEN